MNRSILIILGAFISVFSNAQFLATSNYGGNSTSLLDSLFAYYDLEESSGDALDLVGSNDLPVSGTVTREETGKVGDCYSFDGTDATLGSIADEFDFTGTFSISLWFSTTSASGLDGMATDYDPTGTDYGWVLMSVGNPTCVLYWRLHYDASSATVVGTTDINDGAWYHAVASYNHVDDTMKLWVNGSLDATPVKNTNGVWYSAGTRFHLGSLLTAEYYEGKLDEIAIYRGLELTQAQVLQLYNSGNGLAYPLDY